MTAMERIKERYQNDPRFHALVDTLRREIVELELSPSEIREAAMFAAYMVESARPTGPFALMYQCHGWAVTAGKKCPTCGVPVPL